VIFWAIIVTVVLLLLFVGFFYLLTRTKKNLETPIGLPDLGGPVSITVSEDSAARLSKLSVEPILLRQGPDGARVQIDTNPLLPVTMLTDAAATKALREVAVRASERYGESWTVLVSARDDGAVTMQRLA
jgi:hypothetical protein